LNKSTSGEKFNAGADTFVVLPGRPVSTIQRAKLNIFRASFLSLALVFDFPNPRGTSLFVIYSKLSFG